MTRFRTCESSASQLRYASAAPLPSEAAEAVEETQAVEEAPAEAPAGEAVPAEPAKKKEKTLKAIECRKFEEKLREIKKLKKMKSDGVTLNAEQERKLASEAKTKKTLTKMTRDPGHNFLRDKSFTFKPKSEQIVKTILKVPMPITVDAARSDTVAIGKTELEEAQNSFAEVLKNLKRDIPIRKY